MKKMMIILAMCLFAGLSLNAQPPQGQRGMRGVNLDEIPNITAEQKEKIEKIQAAQQEEMQKMFGQNRGSGQQMTEAQREEMRAKMQELREKANKEIEGILDADQFKVYKEKQQATQQRPRQGQDRGNRQGGGQREHR